MKHERRARFRFGAPLSIWMALTGLFFAAADAATFNVNTGSNLQSVINTAGANGDNLNTIIFAAGTYNIATPLLVGAAFSGRTLELKSSSGAAATILDGGSSTFMISVQSGASSGHLIVDGLTFQNGDGSGSNGGAIHIAWTETTVRNSVFKDNKAAENGGAIALGGNGSSQRNSVLLHVVDSTFDTNLSNGDGGAIQVFQASAEVSGSTFVDNDATGLTNGAASNPRGSGGAILVSTGGTMTIDDSDFTNNEAKFAGGGVSTFNTDVTITNSNFTGNTVERSVAGDPVFTGDGGAIHGETQSENHTLLYEDNTIIGNSAPLGKGGGIHLFLGVTASTATIRGNTIQGNSADLGGGIGNFDCPTGGASSPCGGLQGNSIQIVDGNVIRSNTAESFGGAVFADISDLTFESNLVESNSVTTNHPGLYFQGTKCAIVGANKFLSNTNNGTTGFRDGAVRLKDLRACPSSTRSAVFENNFFWNNSGVEAGALAIIGGTTSEEIDVVGNSFADNSATLSTGGAVWTESDTNFRSNVFVGSDSAILDKKAIRIKGAGLTVEAFNNDFFETEKGPVLDFDNGLGGGSVNYTTVALLNGAPRAGSNTDLDPSFVAAGSGNLHLDAGSAVIDQGDCLLFTTPKVDIDGDTRPAPTLGECDMGADEMVSYALTVSKTGSGGGTVTSSPAGITCGGDCTESYPSGTVVTLTANPNPNSAFTGWSGGTDCQDGQLTMSSARSCTATFVLQRTLDISKLGGGSGTVTSNPAGISCGVDCTQDYVEGTTVDLTAVPNTGSEFGGWGGPADCTDGTLGMLFDFSCTAAFDACASAPSVVNLPAQTVSSSSNFEACNRLLAGSGGFTILAGVTATFRAGNSITLQEGFTVRDGATFTATIGPP